MRKYYKSDIIKNAKPYKTYEEFCVYFLLYDDEIVYVGYSKRILSRLNSHTLDKYFNRVFVIKQPDEKTALKEEAAYIKEFNPIYNKSMTNHTKDFNDRISAFEEINSLETRLKHKYPKVCKPFVIETIEVVESKPEVKIEPTTNLLPTTQKFNLLNDMFIRKEIDGAYKYIIKVNNVTYISNNVVEEIIHQNKTYNLEGKTFGTFSKQLIY